MKAGDVQPGDRVRWYSPRDNRWHWSFPVAITERDGRDVVLVLRGGTLRMRYNRRKRVRVIREVRG